MYKALTLEWLKLKNYRVFWILLGLYLFSLLAISSGGVLFFEFLKSKGAEFNGIDPTIIPIYDFPDVWHNITFLATFVKIFVAFIVVISITNDLTFNTMRQNIIDGISKKEFITSKVMLILALAVVSSIFLFLCGLTVGFIYSHVLEARFIFKDLEFFFLYILDLVKYCCFALMIAILIRKTGFVIVFLMFYSLLIEPIVGVIFKESPIKDTTAWIEPLLPSSYYNMTTGLIEVPFLKYFLFQEVQEGILWQPTLIALAWTGIFIGIIVWRLNRKDIK